MRPALFERGTGHGHPFTKDRSDPLAIEMLDAMESVGPDDMLMRMPGIYLGWDGSLVKVGMCETERGIATRVKAYFTHNPLFRVIAVYALPASEAAAFEAWKQRHEVKQWDSSNARSKGVTARPVSRDSGGGATTITEQGSSSEPQPSAPIARPPLPSFESGSDVPPTRKIVPRTRPRCA